jgi:WD40 repeat protein
MGGRAPQFTIHGYEQHVTVVAYAPPNERAVLTASMEGWVRLSALPDPPYLPPLLLPFKGARVEGVVARYYTADGIRCLAVHPDGQTLFAGGWDRGGLLVSTADGSVRGEIPAHESAITAALFTKDGKRLLTGTADGKVRVWDVATSRLLQGPWTFPTGLIHSFTLSPDGSRALVTFPYSKSHPLLALDGAEAAVVGEWKRGVAGAFLPDGKRLLISEAWGAKVLDMDREKTVGKHLSHTSAVHAVAVDAAGKRAATGAWHVGQIWDLETSNPIGPPLRSRDFFLTMAFSPDSRLVAGLAVGGDARFWDSATGRPVGPVLKHPGVGNTLAFHPDGSTLLIANGDALDFHPDNSTTLIRKSRPVVHRWPVPRPVTEEASRLMLRTQVLTGMEMDADGVVHLLTPEVWRERRRQLEELDAVTVR